MIMFLYSILDRVACDTSPVFEAKNDAVAIRSVQQLLADPESGVSNVMDYDLLCVGSVEHEPFKLIAYDVPRVLSVPAAVSVQEVHE